MSTGSASMHRYDVDSMLIRFWFDVLCPLRKVSSLLLSIQSLTWAYKSIRWSKFVFCICVISYMFCLQCWKPCRLATMNRHWIGVDTTFFFFFFFFFFFTLTQCWFNVGSTFYAHWEKYHCYGHTYSPEFDHTWALGDVCLFSLYVKYVLSNSPL